MGKDLKGKELAKMVEDYSEEIDKCYYKNCLYDWDGSTGFHLVNRIEKEHMDYLRKIASFVLNVYKGEIK